MLFRSLKLTVSRALSDEIDAKQRSLASVKRARQKEIKNAAKDDSQENSKPIKRDVNIPESACETMAKDAMKQTRLLINNPKEITEKDAYDIYKSAW